MDSLAFPLKRLDNHTMGNYGVVYSLKPMEPSDRPDYVVCVLTGYHNENKTWCGREPIEFVFQNPTHAILNAKNNDIFFFF